MNKNDWNKKSEAFIERKEKLKDFLLTREIVRISEGKSERTSDRSIDQNLALHLRNVMHSQMILVRKVINRLVFLEKK